MITAISTRYWSLWQLLHPDKWFPKPKLGAKVRTRKQERALSVLQVEEIARRWCVLHPLTTPSSQKRSDTYTTMPGDSAVTRRRFGTVSERSTSGRSELQTTQTSIASIQIWFHGSLARSRFSVKSLTSGILATASSTVAAAIKFVPSSRMAQVVLKNPITESAAVQKKFNREWYVDSKVTR